MLTYLRRVANFVILKAAMLCEDPPPLAKALTVAAPLAAALATATPATAALVTAIIAEEEIVEEIVVTVSVTGSTLKKQAPTETLHFCSGSLYHC